MMKKTRIQPLIIEKPTQLLGGDLPDALDDFLLSLRVSNRSISTLQFYESQIKHFIWWAQHSEYPLKPSFFQRVHINLFQTYLTMNNHRWGSEHTSANKPISDSSVHGYFRALRAFWNWMEGEEYVEVNPFADRKLKAPKVKKKLLPSYSEEDLQALFESCRNDVEMGMRDLAIMYLLLDTGLRNAELCSLKIEDIDTRRGMIVVTGKGNKERQVVVSNVTLKMIRDYLRKGRVDSESDYLFLARTGNQLSGSGLYQMLARRLDRVGIRDLDSKRFVHKFRHTFALTWIKNGGPLHALQTILGHESPTMSLNYGRMAGVDTKELHMQFSPVENMQRGKRKNRTEKAQGGLVPGPSCGRRETRGILSGICVGSAARE